MDRWTGPSSEGCWEGCSCPAPQASRPSLLTHRDSITVSSEDVQALAGGCIPDHDQLVPVSCGLADSRKCPRPASWGPTAHLSIHSHPMFFGGLRIPIFALVGAGAALAQKDTSEHKILLLYEEMHYPCPPLCPTQQCQPLLLIPGTCHLMRWPCRGCGMHAPCSAPQCPSSLQGPRTVSFHFPPPLWKRHHCHPLRTFHHLGKCQ